MKNDDGYRQLLHIIGVDYERFFERLVKLCEVLANRHGLNHSAEDIAAETVNRMVKKLESGLQIEASDPFIYIKGVALNVVREAQKQEIKERKTKEGLASEAVLRPMSEIDVNGLEDDPRLRCLEECLEELPKDDAVLLGKYYLGGEGRARKEHRRNLAREFGCNAANLRLRAHRARGRLEACVLPCMKKAGA